MDQQPGKTGPIARAVMNNIAWAAVTHDVGQQEGIAASSVLAGQGARWHAMQQSFYRDCEIFSDASRVRFRSTRMHHHFLAVQGLR